MNVPQFTGAGAVRRVWGFLRNPVGFLIDAHRRYGDTAVIGPVLPRRSNRKYVVALGPDNNRAVFGDPAAFRTTGQMRNGPPDSAMRRLRNGLTAMNGAKHRQQRAFISPFFSKLKIDQYCGSLIAEAADLVDQWPAGRLVDLNALMNTLMLRLSAHILFGRENRARLEWIGDMIHVGAQRNLSPLIQLFPFRFPGSPMHRMLREANKLEALLLEMIRERRADPVEDGDLLDSLVHARDADNTQMTDADLLGQTTIIFGASYETQSKAMTWTALLLAQHPRVLASVCDELHHVLRGNPPTLNQLERLPYLDAVLKESMRILPPVPYTLRRATVDAALPDTMVHAGDWVILSHYITHHMPDLYPHPERFWPERWFSIAPTQYEYLPFSAGPRWCIGKPLAMKMMKITLAAMVQRWRWQVRTEARIDRQVRVTMSPKRGLPVVLHSTRCATVPVALRGQVNEMVDWIDREPVTAAAAGRAAA